MTRLLAGIGIVLGLTAAPAEAGRLLVLVDSHRLLELAIQPQYLLPDGRVLDHDRLIRACGAVRAAGWVVYDPDSDRCRMESDVLPASRPPIRPQSSGIVVFDPVSRQHCGPGVCQVIMGAAPGDAVFADRYEAAP